MLQQSRHRPTTRRQLIIVLAGAALLAMGVMLPQPKASHTSTSAPQEQPDQATMVIDPVNSYVDSSVQQSHQANQQRMQEAARQADEEHWA